MTATATPAPPAPGAARPPSSRQRRAAQIVIGATIALIAVMWVYFFFFADERPVARVDDTAWTKRAEEICVQRNELIDDNAAAFRAGDDFSAPALGASVGRTTDLVEEALNAVLAEQPASAGDQEIVAEWAALYRIYIADRRETEAKLLAGEQAELNETTVNGSPVSLTIGDFTKPNRMNSCSVPSGG